jgi:hypothetical protein
VRWYGFGLDLRGIDVSVKVWEWKYELGVDGRCASPLLLLLPYRIRCLCGSRFLNRCCLFEITVAPQSLPEFTTGHTSTHH